MESSQGNSCSVIQYYKGTDTETKNADIKISNSFNSLNSVDEDLKEILTKNNEEVTKETITDSIANHNDEKGETSIKNINECVKDDRRVDECETEPKLKLAIAPDEIKSDVRKCESVTGEMGVKIDPDLEEVKSGVLPEAVKEEIEDVEDAEAEPTKPEPKITKEEKENESSDDEESDNQPLKKGKKRKLSEANADNESGDASNSAVENAEANEEAMESDFEDEEEIDNKPRRRGRCKKNPDIIPSYLSSDIVLGYKILLKFLETPQFSGFHKPFKKNADEEDESKITCFNQIKKKFEENSYSKICEFVNDVREMLVNIYESRNTVAIKKALRLEQILEQRIAQLPNYLRPQCALVLSPEEVNNSHNKIRITKGGGFVSLLLEKTEKKRYEKNREKRKMLAEERKQLKEEQDKDVQEWEKNVLLKDFEEELKSMWELPAIGHFIHLCTDILNIGEVAQFEVERMLLMPQCSDTLDLIMTALLTNSLVRAKLDRTPSMPYSIWGPLVRTRVLSWYRTWHKEGRNEQKLFEEIGVEPDFWQILGPDINPLDYYYFHELSLFQRVWILKTLCDVDFVRKKTVHDNIRAQTLDELSPDHLGMDQQGNRYILFKQFSGSDIRIYRQSSQLDGDISPSELIESAEGFEHRRGPITADKVFRDIWELNEKPEVKTKKKKVVKTKRARSFSKVTPEPAEKKNLRRSVRAKQKTYADWSDSDQSDTDLITLKNKLTRADPETLYRPFSDKEFISLSVFRLPRDKVSKPSSKRSSYVCRKAEDSSRSEASGDKSVKAEVEERKEEAKPSGCEDEQSDSLDAKQMQDIQADFKKIFQGDDMNGDEFNLGEKISNCKLDKVSNDVKFSVKNLENLKMVFTKGNLGEESSEEVPSDAATCEKDKPEESSSTREKEYDALYKYNVPDHLKPDNGKFYLVVDSVEGLRQLISKFGSHENDLEIITRSTKSKKKNNHSSTSSEVQLIERLQNLLLELEPWEFDLMKSCRTNKEKMYKEYINFINRPPDFVHPNEAYWMKTYEEPAPSTASATAVTTTTTTTTADSNATNGEKTGDKENGANETTDPNQKDNSVDGLITRKRTRVTRLQLQPDNNDLDEDFDDGDDYESNESDDNWVLPTPKRKAKKEPAPKTPKLPRRSGGRRSKSSPINKTDSQTNTGEKSQNSSSEKTKKALFWGPRSSDPSEDLNWEKNRQKILEQHNSPVKKVLFKSDEIMNDMAELENAMQHPYKAESPSTSVIKTPPKRYTPQIPGNKKPYFSSAQLKALESQGKKGEAEESFLVKNSSSPKIISPKPEVKSTASNTGSEIPGGGNKAPVKIQTYSRVKKTATSQPGVKSPQTSGTSGQSLTKIAPSAVGNKIDVTNTNSLHLVKFAHQLNKQIQNSMAPVQMSNQSIQNVVASGGGLEQKPVQTQHVGRVQQIQVQQPSGQPSQSRTIPGSVAGVRMQQAVQWQPKVIAVQQPVQTQAQVQIQPQVQLSNQSQVQMQGQMQQVIRLEPQKITGTQQPVQVAAEKMATVQQMVISQAQQPPGIPNADNDLYITDGKLLIKFDQNFVQQYLQKDKVLTLNVNEKLDLKKPLLIVKPKTDTSPGTSQNQAQPSTSQQNILVINKPTALQQQTVVSSSVPNFVIPGNYIIKDTNQIQPQGEQQTVKIVQQTPAYVIQQKPPANKGAQSQIIKIITSQPMPGNQNLILSPANINVANQIIQPVPQTVMGDHQTKSPTTLRFMRPQTSTSTAANIAQSKMNPVQNQIIVNNLVQIPGQRLDASKSQGAVVAGRIVSTGVPTIRMAAPVQTPTVVNSTQGNSQVANPGVQLMKVGTSAQSQQIQNQVVLASGTAGSQLVRSAGHLGTQMGKSGAQPQQVQNQTIVVSANSSPEIQFKVQTRNPQFVTSMATLNPPTLKIATGAQTQVQTQTTASSAGVNSQVVLSTAPLGAQPVRLATTVQSTSANPQLLKSTSSLTTQSVKVTTGAQPQLVQTQTVLVPANPNSHIVGSSAQPVRILAGGQPQQVQAQVLVSSGSLNSQTVRMATSANGQPVRLMSSGQPQPVRFVANNSVGVRFINRNVMPVKATVITSAAQPSVVAVSNVRPSGIAGQPVRLQTVVQPAGVRPVQNRLQVNPPGKQASANTLSNAPVIIKLEDEEDEIRILGERLTEPPVTMDYIHGELSVKKTSQGWKYAVKASNGKDIILTDEQIEERLKANNGVMK